MESMFEGFIHMSETYARMHCVTLSLSGHDLSCKPLREEYNEDSRLPVGFLQVV